MTGAANYAEALFSLSEELRETETVLSDVKTARDVLLANRDYFKLTDTPAIGVPEKLSLINRAFATLGENVRNLLSLLCERHSVHLFPEIAKEYISLYNENRGICPAEVTSAVALTDEQIARIRIKLEQLTGKTIIIKNKIDKELLGGIKLAVMGKQFDGSLKARLTSIENGLKTTIL